MCEDCGCMEGNEKAYADMEKNGHSHSHGHPHTHVTEKKEVHIHIHIDSGANNGADIHLHTSGHGGAAHVHHQHPHTHTHHHDHDHGGENHTHGHAHSHTHPHDHDHVDGNSHSHGHDHADHQDHAHAHTHAHDHGGGSHSHGHPETDVRPSEKRRSRTISLETNVLAGNDAQAKKNRDWLKEKGVVAVNLISSPGSGKTFLLERTLEALRDEIRCAVITGDMQTDNDARRMMGKGARVVQIETRSACHLDARQIEEQLSSVVADGVQLLFIENVGNLVCPAAFDLGEHEKIALVSVAEGEDKPVKYPVLFHGAGVTLITKTDLAPHLEANIDNYKESVKKVQPEARIIEVSAKTGDGMDTWLGYLRELVGIGG